MKRRSFFLRLFVGNLLLVGGIIAFSVTLSYTYLNGQYDRQRHRQQDRLSGALQLYFQGIWDDQTRVAEQCNALARQYEPAELTAFGADGQILATSDGRLRNTPPGDWPHNPEVVALLTVPRQGPRLSIASDVRAGPLGRRTVRHVARPIYTTDPNVPAGAIRLTTPSAPLVSGESFLWGVLLWSALAALLADAILALLVSWIWSMPLRQISRTAEKIASGDLTARASIRGSRELRELASALNEMRGNIATQIELIAQQRENLQTVVGHLREGIVALDDAQHVVLLNRMATSLLAPGAENVTGQHIQSVVRNAEIADLLDEVAPDRPLDRQIDLERNGRRLTLELQALKVPPYRNRGIGTLLVVRDVTELARTHQIKAEFVANASHEMRTPLATLRAAVDTLMSLGTDDPEGMERFLSILDRHVRRLENMTRDLLDLHLVEQARSRLRLEDLALADMAEWAEAQCHARAEAGEVELDVRCVPPEGTFRSDRTLMRLILQNLAENAVKFTPAGGKVVVHLELRQGQLILRVKDTGCGIAPEMQDRVFERFFQADTARTGVDAARGTGLGLAIVKHAADRLAAEIDLQSEVGQGTEVTVTFPPRRSPA